MYQWPPQIVSAAPAAPTEVTISGQAPVDKALLNFASTNVTNAAYVELIASTAAAAKTVQIFMSSGEPLHLAFGAAASEVDKLYIIPGGNWILSLQIPIATRLSVKAVNAVTVSEGVLIINILG